jgi:hypothetical protein
VLSYFRSFKSLVALAALASTLFLAGCGGGGAKDPFDPGPSAPAFVVNPTSVTVYSNIPTVLTISSGVAPFQVFSSDSVVLPLATSVGGSLITLVPSNVSADTVVTVTAQDGLGRRIAIPVTVKPATLVNQVSVTPISNTRCGGLDNPLPGETPSNRTPICSGETATASVIVRTANSAVIPNRQVRFDVVFGAFKFVTDANGANASTTVTAVTDQNGRATTLIKADDSVTSQAAVIRATDLVTGSRVDTAFTIVQLINGDAVLSVVPGGYTSKGFFKGECGGTAGDFLVYGGRPPYTARSSLPNAVRLSVGGVFGDPVSIPAAGDSFRASTFFSSQCGGYEAAIVVTDAAGRNTSVTYKEEAGEEEPPPPVAPPTLRVAPTAVLVTCSVGRTVVFSVAGGVPSYVARSNRPADVSVTQTLADVAVTITSALTAAQDVTVEIVDAVGTKVDGKIDCQ